MSLLNKMLIVLQEPLRFSKMKVLLLILLISTLDLIAELRKEVADLKNELEGLRSRRKRQASVSLSANASLLNTPLPVLQGGYT